MPASITPKVIEALMRESRSSDGDAFTFSILDRLKKENSGYTHLANYLARIIRAELGAKGYDLVRDVAALCYRALELAERQQKPIRLLGDEHVEDILLTATDAEVRAAIEKANGFMGKWRKPMR